MAEPITLPRGIRDYLDGLTAEQVERVLSEPIERWGAGGLEDDDECLDYEGRFCLVDHCEGPGKWWEADQGVVGTYDRICKALGLSVVVTAIKDYLRARHVH